MYCTVHILRMCTSLFFFVFYFPSSPCFIDLIKLNLVLLIVSQGPFEVTYNRLYRHEY